MKIAIAGVWHVHAGEYTATAAKYGELVGVYDENAQWRGDFAKKYSIPEFASYDELLASDAEAVIVCSATNLHPDMMLKAARAGKHIFTEKVLALDSENCEAIRQAVTENGVRFVISFPWKTDPRILAIKNAVDSGAIGEINYLRFRNCHSGSVAHWLPAHFYDKEACGGGAMIDLGAHGMYLTHWFLGEPDGYLSTFTHACRDEKDAVLNPDCVEDNAVTVMRYNSGAIAVNETGFVSIGCPPCLEVGGTLGYLSYSGNKVILRTNSEETELPLPEAPKKPIDAFLLGEEIAGCGLAEACALTRMMEGAYRS